MASQSQHVEVEAAKLLHKLIQESKDEPAKLAMKLHVICQHMRSSGKENSLPYQVISRAMQTVVSQHRLDVEVLGPSHPPFIPGGPQLVDSGHVALKDQETSDNQVPRSAVGVPPPGLPGRNWQAASSSQTNDAPFAGSLQNYGMINDSNATQDTSPMARQDSLAPIRTSVMLSRENSFGADVRQVSVTQRCSKSSDHESQSSLPTEDTRSASSQEGTDAVKTDGQTNKKDAKKTGLKRKKADSKAAANLHSDSMQQPDTMGAGLNSRKGKQASKVGLPAQFAVRSGDQVQVTSSQTTTFSEHLLSVPDRAKQEDGQFPFERTMNKRKISNSPLANSVTKLSEEGEVSSSSNVLGLQKGGLPLSRNSSPHSTSIWNQNQVALPSGNSQGSVPGSVESSPAINNETMYPANDPKNNMHDMANDRSLPTIQSHGIGKVNLRTSAAFSSFQTQKMGFSAPYTNPSFENNLISKSYKEKSIETSAGSHFFDKGKVVSSSNVSETPAAFMFSDKAMMQEREASRMKGNAYNTPQGGGIQEWQTNDNVLVKNMSQASVSVNTPFGEQQLKQLRAQCLVFLAFRNSLMPRKLHLEVALGGSYPKEGGNEDGTQKGNANRGGTCLKEPANSHESSSMFGRQNDTTRITPAPGSSSTGSMVEEDSSKDMENAKKANRLASSDDFSLMAEENKQLPVFKQKFVSEVQTQGTTDSRSPTATLQETDSLAHLAKGGYNNQCQQERTEGFNHQGNLTNPFSSVSPVNTHHKTPFPATSMSYREHAMERVGTYSSKSQNISSGDTAANLSKPDSFMSEANSGDNCRTYPLVKDQHAQPMEVVNSQSLMNPSKSFTHVGPSEKHSVVPKQLLSSGLVDAYSRSSGSDSCIKHDTQKLCDSERVKPVTVVSSVKHENLGTVLEKSTKQEEEEESDSDDMPASSPKYTTSEKWIIDQQKRKLAEERTWVSKHRKLAERVKACIDKSKENVSLSEDLSAKTKNVIELKKLQLLQLQRRLRSDFLNDYFKPITPDIERLKTVKKHRDGRRKKQLERFEQKMKEERQKRIRERQKEFFGEIEAHREKLEDCFKIKRERSKGIIKYVKEFHKRKEKIHREKIDRIQREKINLLKNNDVEGYLRMVQDAKSDRVKQLLKETENYLKKLSSKLQKSKTISRSSETEMGENRAVNVLEINDVADDNEDESDQAQHYLVSNEKYYTMAHSVKESINEQPISLQGGKLREYQMNGLRWLVSLYNNHLNGILADEMGLGKTVQVIALICYLMETKKDRGPFLVVVPSSVLPGWESELSFWAPGINKIIYAGQPEERRRLFKERIIHRKFNVLLTTYEYLMNKHDRPKLSKIQWRYIIIDEGHRLKNASCKLNADLKLYQSSHRLLLTGTPLQNNLEELWALLNFLLPDIFNSSEDFSQWFNKPFEGNGDSSADEALLSEEENLLIINRLHQVLRPFVLRRLKHKVENELPEKIERLVRCEASAYQQLLMKRVEENLGVMGTAKVRSVHNTVMELRNICNHPYLSQLHAEEINSSIPKHYLPPIVRLCGKLEMLDRVLPKLKATGHRVLFFSTMTRLLDIMEDYLLWKHYRYLRLDGHTAGTERGALIREFNRPDSQAFIFLLSIRAGGVGVNLQAADTVIIFDTDWNPQVDLQAQARAHRIGQKKDVLVLRFETVRSVEEQVRASAEHKLGVANQSITAGFFDNNTSAEDRKEYLESLLREGKKEEASPVLDDDALNDLLARSESEIDVFEAVDKQRREEEMASWQILVHDRSIDGSESLPLPSRLVTEEDLKPFYKTMKIYETPMGGVKRKGEHVGGLDMQHYGRGKRAREVRSYEEQWTEEEFEQLCQDDSAEVCEPADALNVSAVPSVGNCESQLPKSQSIPSVELVQSGKEPKPIIKRGRGRPKRAVTEKQPSVPALSNSVSTVAGPDSDPFKDPCGNAKCVIGDGTSAPPPSVPSIPPQVKGRKPQTRETTPRGRGRKPKVLSSTAVAETNNSTGNLGRLDATSNNSEVALTRDGLNVSTNSGIPSVPPASSRKTPRGRGRKQNIVSSTFVAETNNPTGILGKTVSASDKSEVVALSQDGPDVKTSSGNPSLPPVRCEVSSSTGLLKEADLKLAHDLREDITHGVGSSAMQKPAETHTSLKSSNRASSTIENKLGDTLAMKQDDASHQDTPNNVPSAVKSGEKQSPTDTQVNTSLGSQMAVPRIISQSVELNKSDDKRDSSPPRSTHMSIHTCDTMKSSPLSSASRDTTMSVDSHCLETAEFIKHQEQANTDTLMSGSIKNEAIVVYSSAQMSYSTPKDSSPAVLRKAPENKASVTRKKAAAREPRNRSSSTAACERRARLAGLKQAEGLMVDSKGKLVKAVTISKKQDSDHHTVVPVTVGMACNVEERSRDTVLLKPFDEKFDLQKQSNRQLDSPATEENPTRSVEHLKRSIPSSGTQLLTKCSEVGKPEIQFKETDVRHPCTENAHRAVKDGMTDTLTTKAKETLFVVDRLSNTTQLVSIHPSNSAFLTRVGPNEKAPDFVEAKQVPDSLSTFNHNFDGIGDEKVDNACEKVVQKIVPPDYEERKATAETLRDSYSTQINAVPSTADISTTDCVVTGGALHEKVDRCSIGEVEIMGPTSPRAGYQSHHEVDDKDVPAGPSRTVQLYQRVGFPPNLGEPKNASVDDSLANKATEVSLTVDKKDRANSTEVSEASVHNALNLQEFTLKNDGLATAKDPKEIPVWVADVDIPDSLADKAAEDSRTVEKNDRLEIPDRGGNIEIPVQTSVDNSLADKSVVEDSATAEKKDSSIEASVRNVLE